MGPPLVIVALFGFLTAVAGTYWDDAWHTEKGRDSFLIAPHVALYAGIALSGAPFVVAALLRRHPVPLGLLGVAVTLASGPVDNAWHEAFGRDAVVWSPPHMLGVAGTLAIAAALLFEAARIPGRLGSVLAAIAGAAVIGAATVPVLEYETDVPQFDEAWYLPVLALGAAFAFSVIASATRTRGIVPAAAAVHAVVLAAVALALDVGDMPGPALPLLVVPALAFAATRRGRPSLAAAALTGAVFATYVPYLDLLRSDVHVDAADVAIGAPLAFAGAWAAIALVAGRLPARSLAAAPALLLLLLPVQAPAHDPGQGPEAGEARLRAAAVDGRARVEVSVRDPGGCEAVRPHGLVARRAGKTLRGPLAAVGASRGACSLRGAVSVPGRGRWFVYAELHLRGRPVEAWVPLVVSEAGEGSRSARRTLYEPPREETTGLQVAAGIALYALVAALLALIALACRRVPQPG